MNGALVTLGLVGAVAAVGALRPEGSRTLVPFDERRARRDRRIGGELKTEALPIRTAIRKAVLDYVSTLGQYHLDDAEDLVQLEEAYAWKATAVRLARTFPKGDKAMYLHWIESNQPGGGRALHGVLEDLARHEGARWLIAVSVKVDWSAGHKKDGVSPLGFYQKMGWRVLHTEPGENPESEAILVKGPL